MTSTRTTLSSLVFCNLLKQLKTARKSTAVVLCDNAPYHTSKVKELKLEIA